MLHGVSWENQGTYPSWALTEIQECHLRHPCDLYQIRGEKDPRYGLTNDLP